MDTVGVSLSGTVPGPVPLSKIVPVAVLLVVLSTAPPVALASCTRNVSAPSKTGSCVVCTLKVCVVTPAANVRVVVVRAVKSPVPAVSGAAGASEETSTVCDTSEAPARVTVKVIKPPSETLTLFTLKLGTPSFVMVPVAEAVVAVSVTPLVLAPLMVAITVSLLSNTVSTVGSTVKLALSAPAAMVSVPVVAEPL